LKLKGDACTALHRFCSERGLNVACFLCGLPSRLLWSNAGRLALVAGYGVGSDAEEDAG